MQNPLPEPLEECCFSIEGANLTGGHVISERSDESLEAIILSWRTEHQLSHHELETTETFLVNHLKKKFRQKKKKHSMYIKAQSNKLAHQHNLPCL